MESDALVIARWCWPEGNWAEQGGPSSNVHSHGERYFMPRQHIDVRDAELVLIERGLAEAYGEKLYDAVCPDGGYPSSMPGWHGDFAKLATAPLDARVRALAATIRALP